ncbi:hypothetical protein VM1G_12012 [Cytospora mali]|uniref:Uncharacterized protein n=1 Tax=Cytospora mali TaxID=578113 RepID=A0A194VI18_CYTMA|nr:hypothetical protein VM1G_12012 [Valsa mali]
MASPRHERTPKYMRMGFVPEDYLGTYPFSVEQSVSRIRSAPALEFVFRHAKSHDAHVDVVGYSLWRLVEEPGLDHPCHDNNSERLVNRADVANEFEHTCAAVHDRVDQDQVAPPNQVLPLDVLRHSCMHKRGRGERFAYTKRHGFTTAHEGHNGRSFLAEKLVSRGRVSLDVAYGDLLKADDLRDEMRCEPPSSTTMSLSECHTSDVGISHRRHEKLSRCCAGCSVLNSSRENPVHTLAPCVKFARDNECFVRGFQHGYVDLAVAECKNLHPILLSKSGDDGSFDVWGDHEAICNASTTNDFDVIVKVDMPQHSLPDTSNAGGHN